MISSPNIRQDKVDRLLVLVKERQENGVSVTVITTDPEKVVYGNVDMCYALIREMQQVAIHVVTKAEVEERFACFRNVHFSITDIRFYVLSIMS